MTLAELHAALNDFPVVLIIASVVFDLWGTARGRDSALAAAYWCLLGGAASAVITAASGLLAEDRVEQTSAVHQLIENHETLAISLTLVFVALAGWRIWRKNRFSPAERQSYTMVAAVGAAGMIWLSHLGGTMVYRHAAGIPSATLQQELRERADSSATTR